MGKQLQQALNAALQAKADLSEQQLMTYIRLYQLETWLRRIVYVELRSKHGDGWHTHLNGRGAEKAMKSDKSLTHMPTPEQTSLSFISFGTLLTAISDEWALFELYLPPKDIWDAKVTEVEQIRHRIAHFRKGHRDDLQRVVQLLRDIDDGVWKFCTSFNASTYLHPALTPTMNPIFAEYAYLTPFAPRVRNERDEKRKFFHLDNMLELDIEINRRPWQTTVADTEDPEMEGLLYNIYISAQDDRYFEYESYLQSTRDVHPHLVYIGLDAWSANVRLTLPAVLGISKITEVIDVFISAATSSLRRQRRSSLQNAEDENRAAEARIQSVTSHWPEYVIGPDNPLMILDANSPCSMFNA